MYRSAGPCHTTECLLLFKEIGGPLLGIYRVVGGSQLFVAQATFQADLVVPKVRINSQTKSSIQLLSDSQAPTPDMPSAIRLGYPNHA